MSIEERLAWLEELAALHGWAVPKEEAYPNWEQLHFAAHKLPILQRRLERATTLLLRSNDLLQPGFGATDEEREQHAKEIRIFLNDGE